MFASAETERLLLRPIALEDAAQIQQIFPHWEIVRYMKARVPWPYPPDGARKYIEQIALPAMELGETWNWTLRLKSNPEQIIGNLELRAEAKYNRGFWIGMGWQGRGLITEACVWSHGFWFESLGISLLRVSKAAANTASRRVSEKLGMHIAGTEEKEFVSGRLHSEIWELAAAEWQDWKSRNAIGPHAIGSGDIL